MAIKINREIAKFAIAFLAVSKEGEAELEAAWADSSAAVRELSNAWAARYPESDGWETYMDSKEIKNGN